VAWGVHGAPPERDDLVIATKYTGFYKPDAKVRYNFQGNQKKSMVLSLENSLRSLQTSYVDIVS
jgi:aryl-alcohol dehydrogenase-like predicted oxidoreductase